MKSYIGLYPFFCFPINIKVVNMNSLLLVSGGKYQRWVVHRRRVATQCRSSSSRRRMPLLDAGSISVCWQSGSIGTAVSRTVLPGASILSGDFPAT